MSKIDTSYQKLLDYLRDNEEREGITVTEMQRSLWFDHHQKVTHRLKNLEKWWYIRKNLQTWWFKVFDVPVTHTVELPVYGSALCGNKWSAVVQEYPEQTLTFPTSILWWWESGDYSDYFFVKAKWDSMNPYIEDGDLVLIKRYTLWREVDRKVLIVHNEKLKVKIVQRNNNSYFLFSSNAEKLEILNTDDVSVIWYVAKVIKDL
jgi:SOS-response transcriptional repressor LexA